MGIFAHIDSVHDEVKRVFWLESSKTMNQQLCWHARICSKFSELRIAHPYILAQDLIYISNVVTCQLNYGLQSINVNFREILID